MNFLENLQNLTSDVAILENYLSENFDKVYDHFEFQKHSDLIETKEDLRKYISLNISKLRQLDSTNSNNLSFLSLLLDVSERVGLSAQYKLIYDLLKNTHFDFGSRLKASSLYLIDVDNFNSHIERYDAFYHLLQQAYELEEDNNDKLLATVINYYSKIVIDFGQFYSEGVLQIKTKILSSIQNDENSFLRHEVIESVLGINIENFEKAYSEIHFLLDSYLGREIVLPTFNPNFLIEQESEYTNKLSLVNPNFYEIKNISVTAYNAIRDDSIFNSLQRGVKILTDEAQLFAYMYSFGNMHYEKLITAFNGLPREIFNKDVNLIDWGCGQAMASITYFDYLQDIGIERDIKYCTLIEPSEIALMRASAHVTKYYPDIKIQTINKTFNIIEQNDLITIPKTPNLHLFSNVIDMESFPFGKIFELIDSTFIGENYFICVSPFVDDIRTNRLNTFIKHFSNYPEFALLESIDNKKGQWKSNWSRVVRVFKCTID